MIQIFEKKIRKTTLLNYVTNFLDKSFHIYDDDRNNIKRIFSFSNRRVSRSSIHFGKWKMLPPRDVKHFQFPHFTHSDRCCATHFAFFFAILLSDMRQKIHLNVFCCAYMSDTFTCVCCVNKCVSALRMWVLNGRSLVNPVGNTSNG